MIKKAYILIFLLTGLFYQMTFAQGSSQATMRVSVTVVSGSSVNVDKPELVLLSNSEKSDLGTVNFKGINEGDVFINNSSKILLTDKDGNQVTMNIESNKKQEKGANSIQFEGSSKGQLMSSVYQGELTTSIEYF